MRLKQRERGLNSVTQMPGVVRLLVRVFARAFVDVAYRGVLGRRPDHEGLLAHTGYLRKVGNLADLLFQMISSNEFNALVAPGMPTANPTRPAAKVRAVLIGNCQVFPLGALMEAMSGYEVQASCVELLPFELAQLELPESDIYQLVGAADVVFCHPHKGIEILKRVHPAVTAKLRWMPKIGFSGFHPDMDYVVDGKGENVAGPMGHYQSALAFFGWSSGLSVDETVALFRQDIFQHLGYFEHMAVSIKLLKEEGHVTDLLLDDLILQGARADVLCTP